MLRSNAIVLELGRLYTRCGFAGEEKPRCVLHTHLVVPRAVQTHRQRATLSSPNLFDNSMSEFSASQLDTAFYAFLRRVYFQWLLVDGDERSVLLVENTMSLAPRFRKSLARVLFTRFKASRVDTVSSHAVAMLPLMIDDFSRHNTSNDDDDKSVFNVALVVDVGARCTVALPVAHGHGCVSALCVVPVGAADVLDGLRDMLLQRGDAKPSNALVHDLLVRSCYVASASTAAASSSSESSSESSEMSQETCDYVAAADLLFEGTDRSDYRGVASAILDSLDKANGSLRRLLAANILLIGGITMLPGFGARLHAELHALLGRDERYVQLRHLADALVGFVPSSPYWPSALAWTGASLLAALPKSSTSVLSIDRDDLFAVDDDAYVPPHPLLHVNN
jgi:actin-related protein 10